MCANDLGAGGRCANVLRWIAKARALHGDAYDYDLVTDEDYQSGKVTIVCREHGPFRQWKGQHLTKRNSGNGYMGCRKCGDESRARKTICKFCGVRAKYCPSRVCASCAEKRKKERTNRSATRFTCPQCGAKHGKHATKFCSVACWKKSTGTTKETFSCVVCGRERVRYKRSGLRNACCSQSCASKYNAILGQQRAGNWDARLERGRQIRDKWKRQDSARRHKGSEVMAWARAAGIRKAVSADCDWLRKCKSGSAMLDNRKRSSEARYRASAEHSKTWESACVMELKRLAAKTGRRLKLVDPWHRRAQNWVGNIKHRRYRVNKAKEKSQCNRIVCDDSGPRVQMCFEWNEGHSGHCEN